MAENVFNTDQKHKPEWLPMLQFVTGNSLVKDGGGRVGDYGGVGGRDQIGSWCRALPPMDSVRPSVLLFLYQCRR